MAKGRQKVQGQQAKRQEAQVSHNYPRNKRVGAGSRSTSCQTTTTKGLPSAAQTQDNIQRQVEGNFAGH